MVGMTDVNVSLPKHREVVIGFDGDYFFLAAYDREQDEWFAALNSDLVTDMLFDSPILCWKYIV